MFIARTGHSRWRQVVLGLTIMPCVTTAVACVWAYFFGIIWCVWLHFDLDQDDAGRVGQLICPRGNFTGTVYSVGFARARIKRRYAGATNQLFFYLVKFSSGCLSWPVSAFSARRCSPSWFARGIILHLLEQKSEWDTKAISPKVAVGL